jgi:hypothetical protein
MQVQRTSRRRERQIAERGAALEHFFSKAVVQASPNGLSLNRSFAATPFDVSHADKAAMRWSHLNRRERHIAAIPNRPDAAAQLPQSCRSFTAQHSDS